MEKASFFVISNLNSKYFNGSGSMPLNQEVILLLWIDGFSQTFRYTVWYRKCFSPGGMVPSGSTKVHEISVVADYVVQQLSQVPANEHLFVL